MIATFRPTTLDTGEDIERDKGRDSESQAVLVKGVSLFARF